MRMTSNDRATTSRLHWAQKFHGVAALLLLAACGTEDDPASGFPDTGTSTSPSTGDSGSTGSPGGNTDAGSTGGPGGNPSGTSDSGFTPRDSGTTTTGPDAAGAADTGTGGSSEGGTTGSDSSTPTSDGGGGAPTDGVKSAGCGKAPPATDPKSIKVGSDTGTYLLDVPTDYNNSRAYPLIFVWHGSGVPNSSFRTRVGVSKAAGNDAIVVTPECLNGGSTWPRTMDYFDEMLAYFSANYCVDTSRVFTTGHSMGGMFTATLGCQRGNKLRGNAVLAAPLSSAAGCTGDKMAGMFVVGTMDSIGNVNSATTYWTGRNKCDAMTAPAPFTFENMTYDYCKDYTGCANAPVRICSYPGNHAPPTWLGTAIWDFFKKL